MQFSEAKVAELLRCAQRDETLVSEFQDSLQSVFKLLGARNYHGLRRVIPGLANGWYYFMTTLGNLQTLGEEYTGTIRLNSDNRIPSKLLELLWLLLYIGGEPLLERLISRLRSNINNSRTMTEQAKSLFVGTLNFVQEHKQTFRRIHHSLFYIDGKYYNIANRITGIKYVLVREWMQDDTFTNSFRILGYLSLGYILVSFAQQVLAARNNGYIGESSSAITSVVSAKGCVLCAENRKNASATPCGHVFCWDCIYDSLKYQQNCPICREVVTPNRIVFLQNFT